MTRDFHYPFHRVANCQNKSQGVQEKSCLPLLAVFMCHNSLIWFTLTHDTVQVYGGKLTGNLLQKMATLWSPKFILKSSQDSEVPGNTLALTSVTLSLHISALNYKWFLLWDEHLQIQKCFLEALVLSCKPN